MEDDKFNELYDVLSQFKDAIDFLKAENDGLKEQLDSANNRMGELENTLFEKIIKPTEAATNEAAFNEFHDKYGERLDPYNEKLRALEGDDSLDLSREAFNGFKDYSAPEGMEPYTEAEYVDALIEQVNQQIDTIKEKLGLPEDSKTEVVEDENGNIEVINDGEVVASESTDTDVVEEPATDEEVKSDEEEDDGQPSLFEEETMEPSEEEMAEIRDELAELKKEKASL